MKKLNSKALEVLDICLAAESPEILAKVYEILEISELDASDPMFLVLALTGQMRVLLEAAPADLSKLLTNWKETSATSRTRICPVRANTKNIGSLESSSLISKIS